MMGDSEMPIVATPIDERGQYQWVIEINGLSSLYAVKATLPKVTAVTRKRGQAGAQMEIKVPTGGMTVDDLVLEKVVPGRDSDSWAWDLILRAIDEPVNDAIFAFTVVELDPNGARLESWDYKGFVAEVDPGERTEDKEARVIEKVTIAITEIAKN